MRKMKYIIVSTVVILLIIIISALPFGISSFLDSTTHGQSHQSNIDTIQLNIISDLTPIQKLRLVGQGGFTPVSNNQATLTKDKVEQYAMNNLERFTSAGLIDYADGDWVISTCEPVLYYDIEKAERNNIFWKVQMEGVTNQSVELLIDDYTGEMYFINYSSNVEIIDEDISINKTNVEHFATCYLGDISVEYSIVECRQTESNAWMMNVVCSDGMDEVIIELYLSIEGLHCTIN